MKHHKFNSKIKSQKSKLLRGQSLIEVIVALGVAVILAVSLITTSLITQKSARSARNNTQATKLVQEYLEQIRIFRDRKGFPALVDTPITPSPPCHTLNTTDADPVNWTLVVCSGGSGQSLTFNNTQFTRKLVIANAGTNGKLITVSVSWSESGGPKAVSTQTFLTDWECSRNRPCL